MRYANLLKELRGYHGTDEPKIFQKTHTGTNSHVFGNFTTTRTGTFFSDNSEFAKIYGNHVKDFELNLDNVATDLGNLAYNFWTEGEENGVDRDILLLAREVVYGGAQDSWHLFEDELGEHFVSWLIEKGYDGAMFEEYLENDDGEEISGTTYVVFDPIDIIPINRDKQLDMFAVNENRINKLKREITMTGYFLLTEDRKIQFSEGDIENARGSFVQSWQYDPENRSSAYVALIEAAALGADPKYIGYFRNKWSMDNGDCEHFAQKNDIILENSMRGWTAKFPTKDVKMVPRKGAFGALVELASRCPLLFRQSVS